MPLKLSGDQVESWSVRKIAVIGPGIVGMPMAALLAHARIREGSQDPAKVVVIQRASPTSGWKVEAINAGRSPIGGVEPDLDRIVAETAAAGLLSATHDINAARDADVVLICVQTDKKGIEPDYDPLFEALNPLAEALKSRPAGNVPLIIFESTLAPSSMATLIRDHFAKFGLVEGRDILLGNSPNRVMPGRLVERVAASDKIVAGLRAATPLLIERLYRRIVTQGRLYPTNSLTAEIVKTLENAYRDVRIAAAAEIVRYCDEHDIDFFALRDQVNHRLGQSDTASGNPLAVPTGALLVPMLGVGGHCLPKDGILLWWRKLAARESTDRSLIIESRRINDESPKATLDLAEASFGQLHDCKVALLGAAYRADSEDTRNSPTFALAHLLLERGCRVVIQDPHVRQRDPNLVRLGLDTHFTTDVHEALDGADYVFFCIGHAAYREPARGLLASTSVRGVVDACNLCPPDEVRSAKAPYVGIGRGRTAPEPGLVGFVLDSFRAIERGVANEVNELVNFLNQRYADTEFSRADFNEVRRLAGTCTTGCVIEAAGEVRDVASYHGFLPRLVHRAAGREPSHPRPAIEHRAALRRQSASGNRAAAS
jgi:UDP-N-acetyl-D-mannosaminuronic acid dehydrogenase